MELDKEYKDLLLEEQLEDKMNSMLAPQVRLTSLRRCNSHLDLYYTMSLTDKEIKSYMYYKDKKCILIVMCGNWKEMKNAIYFHSMTERVKTWEAFKKLIKNLPNEKIIKFE